MNPFFSDVNFFRGWFEIYEFIGRRQIHFGSFLLFPRVHRVFCRSACLMWQCVTPSNFQTSTLWSRRYLADTPYSPISTLLSPCSAIIIFHFSLNSPWPDCCCTIIIITFELTSFLCFWSHTNSYNTMSYIRIRTMSSTSLKTNSYIRIGLTTYYQVRHTNL